MMRVTAFAILLVVLATPAWAGWNEGVAAIERGDYATALREFRVLAAQGHAGAQTILGIMYADGEGVPQDDAEAVKWYRKAAKQGDAYAQYNLGVMYDKGRGVLQDYAEAARWYRKAAEQGDETARKNRDIVAKRMTPEQIAEAQRLAREWKPKQ